MPNQTHLDRWQQGWNNLKFRSKLTLLLLAAAILPTALATQGILFIAQSKMLQSLQEGLGFNSQTLHSQLEAVKRDVEQETEYLATFVESQEGDVTSIKQQELLRRILPHYVSIAPDKSFYLITDAQGRTIAQYIQVVEDPSDLVPEGDRISETKYRSVALSTGINLGDIPIFQDTLSQQRSLSGLTLLKGEWLQRLGLAEQANIGLKTFKIEGLPEAKQPFPEGTYDVDGGRVGLAVVAVRPIRQRNQVVGTVMVGLLLNRNYEMIDRFIREAGINAVTICAEDWRVSTNAPNTDGKTRSIGTRLARQVAEPVLNQQKVFEGSTNIAGTEYLANYSPLYDYRQALNPSTAKPIGVVLVGKTLSEVQGTLQVLQLIGWGLGLGIAAVMGLVAMPIASSFAIPLQRLTKIAQQLSAGDLTAQVSTQETLDEIGELQTAFRRMTDNLNSLIRQVQQSGVQITSSATQIAASGKELEATVTEQVASSYQVAATAKEIAATAQQQVQTMATVEAASLATATAAGGSQTELMQMQASMGKLTSVNKTISGKLGTISDQANNINSIVTTIAKVAEQTNLLSLNAAIEAEKAGEYGVGFAVVAREIRRLADQTAIASLDIESMVKQMQGAVSAGVMEMDRFTLEVERCVADVGDISAKLEVIIHQVQTLTPRFQQVSAGMSSQSEGAQQISMAMSQLTEASGQTAESLREINRAIGELNDAGVGLRQEISRFKIRGT